MILFDEGKLLLDEKVSHYLPRFTGGNKDEVTVRQLLMHRGGLPAGRDLWRHAHTPEEARTLMFVLDHVIHIFALHLQKQIRRECNGIRVFVPLPLNQNKQHFQIFWSTQKNRLRHFP